MALTDNNTVYYDFDEASGTTIDDRSVNSNDATLPDVGMRVTGKVGDGAVAFDGTEEIVKTVSLFSGATPDCSIAIWVKPIGTTGFPRVLSYIADTNNGFVVSLDASSNANAYFRLKKNGNIIGAIANNTLTANTWNLIVGTYDSSTNTPVIYVNNTAYTGTATTGGVGGVAGELALGSSNGSSFFNGETDEFGYWSRILTAQERTDLYNAGSGFNPYDAVVTPTVTTQAASSITDTTATLNGNVTDLGDETTVSRAFDYRVVGAGSWTRTTPDTGVTATGAYTEGITGLTAEEDYEYRSVVIYDTTEEVYGSTVDFTTAAGPTAPTVTTQAVTDVATTTATGNGNVTTDGGETVTERGVCWSTTTAPTTADSTATSAGTTGAFTPAITGLTAETLYYVRAYAINSEGTSYGSEVTFTTTEVTVPKYAAYTKIAGELVRIS